MADKNAGGKQAPPPAGKGAPQKGGSEAKPVTPNKGFEQKKK